jgi:hypothetical protein
MSEMWLIARSSPIAIASLHKCASTSLRASPVFCNFFSHHRVLDAPVPTRIAFIRHPIDRIVSAWRGFHVRDATQNWRWGLGEAETADWEKFVDHTFEHENAHWDPQIPQLTYRGEFVPTEVHRFEAVQRVFEDLFPGQTLSHENKSMEAPNLNLNYRREELIEKYIDDFRLWQRAGSRGGEDAHTT